MTGYLSSDMTPLDTDFSEITSKNLENNTLRGIVNSTFSAAYGKTFYVIKKENYNEDISYTRGDETQKTRYIRTGVGSNNISCILTSEWSEKNAYTMAQNGIYIPVVDIDSEQVVFTYEQYKEIRDKMKGLSFYRADDFEIDESAFNPEILRVAEKMKEDSKGKTTTEEKRERIVEQVKRALPKTVVQDMSGNLSSEVVEFIDTGSTGRGTNIPGDGDFDFMLKCANKDEQERMINLLKEKFSQGKDKGGTNGFNIRYGDVRIDGIDTPVDIDITSERKKLEIEYSSDLCIRDRLDNIRKKYGEEATKKVIDNIIVAKKVLKNMDTYKKSNSVGHTDFGGFGGIGVENWILQNGGSFILAMETFLDNTRDEKGQEVGFDDFKRKYPIYDFGQNHTQERKT